jgi:hypothetical protein
MDKNILNESEPGAPAHAKIAAAVMRAYDLLAAGEGPQTAEEWESVTMILTSAGIACEVASAGQEKERRERPRPRMAGGGGFCDAECPLFNRDGASSVGWCALSDGHRPTRDGVYCGAWVERQFTAHNEQVHALTQRIDELRAEQPAQCPPARPVDANTGALIREAERREQERACERCKGPLKASTVVRNARRGWTCEKCGGWFLAKEAQP